MLEKFNRKTKLDYIFLLFAKEKTNILTKEETKMMQYYREFDLERLLTFDLEKYPLTNRNAGLISISDDQIYASTCTKHQHSGEIDYHIRKQDRESELTKEDTIFTIKEKFHEIVIQVCLKELIIWTPEELNSFQKEQLLSILEKVKKINETAKIEVLLDKMEEVDEISTDINDVIEFINNIKIHKIS